MSIVVLVVVAVVFDVEVAFDVDVNRCVSRCGVAVIIGRFAS
jgi:hypothetical protein